MRKYVYGHKTTRAYEAELVQTLRLAMRLEPKLPDDTPEAVRKVLQERGNVGIKDYLMLDDEVMWWALRRWAAWSSRPDEPDGLPEALKRHATRLVRRKEPWQSEEIEGPSVLGAQALIDDLVAKDDALRYECCIDDLAELPYKAYRYPSSKAADDEQTFFKEIFLLDSKGGTVPLSKKESAVLDGLSEESHVFRFHFDRRFSKEFRGLLKKFGVC